MAHKVHPEIFRVGQHKTWKSLWFHKINKEDYRRSLKQDVQLRSYLLKKLVKTGIDRIEIKRTAAILNIIIYTARPGLLIGRGGDSVEKLKEELKKMVKKDGPKSRLEIRIQIEQVQNPEGQAHIVAQNIAEQLEKRMPFRRTIKQTLEKVAQAKNVQGAKIMVKGRLDGSEIARREWLAKGKLPLQTLRADIDYATATAFTTYGTVGIKVWIYKGEIFNK